MGFDESELEEVTPEEAAAAGAPPANPVPRPAPGPVQQPKVVTGTMEQIVAGLLSGGNQQPQTAEEAIQQTRDTYMQDVDKRLELAMVYREFLNGSMFEGGTEASRIAETEIRGFVRERLGDLMNIETPSRPKVQQLTDAEVAVVRALADLTPEQILGLKLVADKFRSMTGAQPARPAPAPAPTPAAPARPTLIRRQVTAPAEQAAPPPPPVPVPTRRPGPGRGHKGPQAPFRERETVHPDGNGKTAVIVTRDARKQRPAGMLPMPASNLEMEAATAMASAKTAAKIQSDTQAVKAIVAINNTPTETE